VRDWVALAFRAIATTGAYVSGRAQREDMTSRTESTSSRMMRHLHPSPQNREHDILPEITDEQAAKFLADADAALAWVASDIATKPELSDFDHNLVVISRLEAIEAKHLGIAAYLPEAFRRHLGAVVARKAREESGKLSAHLGAVGERMKGVKVTVTGTHSWETAYGTQYLFKFVTPDGSLVAYKSSNSYLSALKRGEMDLDATIGTAYLMTATVKGHGEFRGVRETVVTRGNFALAVA
jgi:hypothetical protein